MTDVPCKTVNDTILKAKIRERKNREKIALFLKLSFAAMIAGAAAFLFLFYTNIVQGRFREAVFYLAVDILILTFSIICFRKFR